MEAVTLPGIDIPRSKVASALLVQVLAPSRDLLKVIDTHRRAAADTCAAIGLLVSSDRFSPEERRAEAARLFEEFSTENRAMFDALDRLHYWLGGIGERAQRRNGQ